MKKLIVAAMFCVVILSGCKESKTELEIINSSTQDVEHIYLDQTDLLFGVQVVKAGTTQVFDCVPNEYDLTIRTADFFWKFDSIQIRKGTTTKYIVMDPIFGSPPPPEVQETPAWYAPRLQVSALIHYVYLYVD